MYAINQLIDEVRKYEHPKFYYDLIRYDNGRMEKYYGYRFIIGLYICANFTTDTYDTQHYFGNDKYGKPVKINGFKNADHLLDTSDIKTLIEADKVIDPIFKAMVEASGRSLSDYGRALIKWEDYKVSYGYLIDAIARVISYSFHPGEFAFFHDDSSLHKCDANLVINAIYNVVNEMLDIKDYDLYKLRSRETCFEYLRTKNIKVSNKFGINYEELASAPILSYDEIMEIIDYKVETLSKRFYDEYYAYSPELNQIIKRKSFW